MQILRTARTKNLYSVIQNLLLFIKLHILEKKSPTDPSFTASFEILYSQLFCNMIIP